MENTNKKTAICRVGTGHSGGPQGSARMRDAVARAYRGRQGD